MTTKKAIEISRGKRRGKPFAKGNPGRPKGARNKTSVALEALLNGQAEAIIAKAAELAVKGDPVALRLCFDRILGVRQDRPISLDLPPIKTARDGVTALAVVVAAVSSGQITPSEGTQVSQLISMTIKAVDISDLEQRIEKLEPPEKNS